MPVTHSSPSPGLRTLADATEGSGATLDTPAATTEITASYARAYRDASKKHKSRLLDEIVVATGWSRDNTRRRLREAARSAPSALKRGRARKYSADAVSVLQKLWEVSGGECGRYLAVAMPDLITALERHGELRNAEAAYSAQVRTELLSMSPATIDRYLAQARATVRSSESKSSPMVRTWATTAAIDDGSEETPGILGVDTVVHCGRTRTSECACTLQLTDVRCGWVLSRSIRTDATVQLLEAMKSAMTHIPFEVTGLHFNGGSDVVSPQGISYGGEPPHDGPVWKVTQPKTGHLVHRYAFNLRYDSAEALSLLNQLWPLVNDRLNYFTPTKRPSGWATDARGRRRRVYDSPRIPLDRLLSAGVLSPAQQRELNDYRDRLNPAEISRRIQQIQGRLVALAQDESLNRRALEACV